MKFVRYQREREIRYGLLDGETVRPIEGDPFSEHPVTKGRIRLQEIRLLAPCTPSKIVAVGVNYRAHATEFGRKPPKEPILFLKPSSSVLDPDGTIRLPEVSSRVDFEAELAVVLKKKCSNIPVEEVADVVFGYTCINDVTARDLQKRDGQWTRAKSFDTFAPFGPCIETELDPSHLKVESYLNAQRRQSANTEDLIFKVPELVSFISKVMTLMPGDLIATGTPAGVGPMKPGDRIEIVIEGIGRLTNTVA